MKRTEQFDNVFDECLEQVLRGENIEQCLGSYPEHAPDLEPLLTVALSVRKTLLTIEPCPEFQARARNEFRLALTRAIPDSNNS